ncbi:MAG: lysophospholipid acyltransferase family protein [Chlamydiae bacterium]|nr:lysophospholipid acyltransferase family protein [Chlamydiota bacterium]MBI3277539.1 lysophospholipid acyltransferase family protein [Chlamydiota bacterium]
MKFNSLSEKPWLRKRIFCLGVSYIQWIGSSLVWRIEGEKHYLLERCKNKPIIFAFWHNQLMMMPFCYLALTRRQKMSALISQSRDGQIVSDLIHQFGFEAIRGSSSRGGFSALLKLQQRLKEGFDLAVTPDGPRGPCGQAQLGVIGLAAVSGASILPIAYDADHKKVLQTWDRFKIPYPYSRAALVAGSPLEVPPHRDPEMMELKRQELQKSLEEVNRYAENIIKK